MQMKYKMPFDQFKHLQKMSKNEFSRWCETFGKSMWEQGYQDACKDKGIQELPETVMIIDTADAVVVDMSYDEIYNKILSIKGVGPKLCEKIMDKLYEDDDNCTDNP